MPVPQEVDDLERLISGLTQEIGKRKASLKTLQTKIEAAQQHLDRCRYFEGVCGESLERLRKSDVVSLEDYKRMLKLYHDNHDLILKYQIEVSNRVREKNIAERDIPIMEQSLKAAQSKLSQWGQVLPIKGP